MKKKAFAVQYKRNYWLKTIRRLLPYERQLKQAVADVFNDIQKEVTANINNEFSKDFKSFFNVSLAITKLKKKTLPILSRLSNSSTKSGLSIISQSYVAEDWLTRNARISKKHSEKIAESINTLDKELKEDVRRSLARNTTRDPQEQLSKLIEDTNNKFNGYYKQGRAETIARTNTTAVDNEVKKDTWKEMGVRELEWVTEGDDRVRDSHEAMDGTRIDIDGSFSIEIYDSNGEPTGEFTESPFPAGGQVASQDVNCRCTLLPII